MDTMSTKKTPSARMPLGRHTAHQHAQRLEALLTEAEALAVRLRHVRRTDEHAPPPAARGRYYVGDDGPTAELLVAVQAALTAGPMTFQAIREATGARDNRLKGAIMRLQREGVRVVNMGTETKAIWFIPSDAVWARLQSAAKRR